MKTRGVGRREATAAGFAMRKALALPRVAKAAEEPIRYGVSGPFSGDDAAYGVVWKNGMGMAVDENLRTGEFGRRDRVAIRRDLQRMYDLFPRLGERRTQLAGTMSGGEQQMLATARALLSRPKLILIDEPTMGLASWSRADAEALLGDPAAQDAYLGRRTSADAVPAA